MNKTFWAIIVAIVVIFGGILLFKGDKAGAPNTGGASPTNHLFGEGKSGVKLVEYGDYQCPYCGEYYPVVNAIKQKYQEQITFQFRNLPLLQIHQNALAAARAAEAASLQNKFWEMYDMLFQSQDSWGENSNARTVFEQYAEKLGLNMTQFKSDFASSKVNNTINADIAAFDKTGQQKSTPTFFLDGKKITPLFDATKSVDENVATFSQFIDNAIAAKKQS